MHPQIYNKMQHDKSSSKNLWSLIAALKQFFFKLIFQYSAPWGTGKENVGKESKTKQKPEQEKKKATNKDSGKKMQTTTPAIKHMPK